jgi:hypothetical protein
MATDGCDRNARRDDRQCCTAAHQKAQGVVARMAPESGAG